MSYSKRITESIIGKGYLPPKSFFDISKRLDDTDPLESASSKASSVGVNPHLTRSMVLMVSGLIFVPARILRLCFHSGKAVSITSCNFIHENLSGNGSLLLILFLDKHKSVSQQVL